MGAAPLKKELGRQTEVRDCAWLAHRIQHGLVRDPFIPSVPILELRELPRHP